jgi:hypothetical protein
MMRQFVVLDKAPPHRCGGRGHGPRRGPLDRAEATPKQRGPYRGRNAALSYEERLARRQTPRPVCGCGCGTLTRWLPGKGRWAVYAMGHYRQFAPYKNEAWLRREYVSERRTLQDIATECGVSVTTVVKAMSKMGISRRDSSDAHVGRQIGADNPAWKGGVADWDYAADWKVIARKIRDRDEWTCKSCGEQRKRWGHALHVHHIDEDKLNNDPENLISLCASCHQQTHREGVMI